MSLLVLGACSTGPSAAAHDPLDGKTLCEWMVDYDRSQGVEPKHDTGDVDTSALVDTSDPADPNDDPVRVSCRHECAGDVWVVTEGAMDAARVAVTEGGGTNFRTTECPESAAVYVYRDYGWACL